MVEFIRKPSEEHSIVISKKLETLRDATRGAVIYVIDQSGREELTGGGRSTFDENLEHVVSTQFVQHESEVTRELETGTDLGALGRTSER